MPHADRERREVVILDVQEDKARAVVESLPEEACFVHVDATKEDSVATQPTGKK